MATEPLVFDLPADLTESERVAMVRRWRARARALGGDAWRVTRLEVGVVLPEGVPVRGGRPLRDVRRPCTVGA